MPDEPADELRQRLERAHDLLERTQRRARILLEANLAVTSSLDLDRVLETLLDHVAELVPYDSASVMLLEGQIARLFAGRGYQTWRDPESMREVTFDLRDNAILKRLVGDARSVVIDDTQTDSRWEVVAGTEHVRSWLGVPLISAGRVIGIYSLDKAEVAAFTQEHVELAKALATQASLAIQNARLYASVDAELAERRRTEAALHAAKTDAEAANVAKSNFLANMSHELRTPLNAIIGFSEILEEQAEEDNDSVTLNDIRTVLAAGRHLLRLVNGVLDLSRIEAGRMEVFAERFDVGEMVNEVATTIRAVVDGSGNRLEIALADGLGTVTTDRTKLRQVLFNLLSNAAKFTERGTITLSASRDSNGHLTLAVADDGIGMAPEDVERIFEPFTQADASTTRRFGGTGLGLAICREFCNLLGGSLTVATQPGMGATFTVTLTEQLPPPLDALEPESSENGPLVLIADDEEPARELLRRTLTRHGYRTVLACSGPEALSKARSHRPDVITLDVMMPGMDGWSVLTALRADRDLASIPVLMVTMVDDQNLAVSLGASDFLTKPVDRGQLLAAVARWRPTGGAEKTVLLVEDDPQLRRLMQRMLERASWRVVQAENGAVALQWLRSAVPHVILLDLMMPEVDGFEVLEALQTRDDWRKIPVIVLTAKDLTRAELRQLRRYALAVVQKGSEDTAELLERLNQISAPRSLTVE